jgi:hypothetical protein
VRIVESAAFTTSALIGGLLASATSPRLTYFLTIPFVLASTIAFSRFHEPRLHRAAEPLALRRHVATTVHAMTRIPSVRRMLLLAALTALLSQAVFEFGPLWLVALHAPAAAFGPYWALLVATLGVGGYLAARVHLGRRRSAVAVAVVLTAAPILLTTSHSAVVIAAAQTVLQLTLAVAGIYAGRLLHDAVPSHIRAGVSSGAGTDSAPWPAPTVCTRPGGSLSAPALRWPCCWCCPRAPYRARPPRSKPISPVARSSQ